MIRKMTLATLALTLGTQAFAQGTTATAPAASGTSTATTPAATAPKLIDKFTASYAGVFQGPSVLQPGSLNSPDGDTMSGGGPIVLKNYASIGYRLSPNVTIAPVAYWTFASKGAGANKDGVLTTLKDPYLKVSLANLYKGSILNYSADVRYAAPVSDASVAAKSLGYLRTTQNIGVDIPNSRLSLGVTGMAILTAYANSSAKFTNLALYAGPNMNFQATPNLAVTVLYELPATLTAGSGIKSDGTDLEPGLSWDITPRVNFSPFLDLKTSTGIKMETTSLNAMVSVRLL